MIIDFHTHFYPDKIVAKALATASEVAHITPRASGTRDGLIASMKQAGIDLAVGLPLVTHPGNGPGLIRWAVRNDAPPVKMLGSVHPRDPEYAATLDAVVAAGFPGVKVHPEYQNFSFDEPALDPVWDAVAERGLFLITHAGADSGFPPPWHSDPASLRRLHERHKNLTLVLAHGGSWGMWDEVHRCLAGLPVYVDLAFVTEKLPGAEVVKLIRAIGVERCLFGTDSPWCDQREALDNVRRLGLGSAELEAVLGGNAARLLKL